MGVKQGVVPAIVPGLCREKEDLMSNLLRKVSWSFRIDGDYLTERLSTNPTENELQSARLWWLHGDFKDELLRRGHPIPPVRISMADRGLRTRNIVQS